MKRRSVFLASAFGALCAPLGRTARGSQYSSPNARLNHACIGVGGMGGADINNIKSHPGVRIVALCDVDKDRLEKASKDFPGARTYADWRELLASEGDKIDSVNVSVPDHMHAIIAANAMRAGKHVYCQKPLCHEIAECRLLRDIAKERGVVTQLGIQHSAGIGDRTNVELLKNGAIGAVEHVYLFSNRDGISRIQATRPEKPDPVPPSLEWDLWLGTAPGRPYAEKLYHPLIWRVWQDFGSAWVGDIGCHLHSSVWKGLGLTAPVSVKAEVQESWKNTPARFRETWPQGAHITWIYPGNAKTADKPLTVDWYDGRTGMASANLLPPPEISALAKEIGFETLPHEGLAISGSEGWIFFPLGSAPRLVLKDKNGEKPPRPVLPPSPSHYFEFLDGCLAGKKTSADFSVVVPMVESVLLGNVAERLPDTRLDWDAEEMRISNFTGENQLLRRSYREGWELPGIV